MSDCDISFAPYPHLSFLSQHVDYVKAIAYASETHKLVSGGLDRSVVLWDLAAARLSGNFELDIKTEVCLRAILVYRESIYLYECGYICV